MTHTPNKPLTIGIIAGEVSGDALGADFMAKINALCPDVRWVGVGGRLMSEQGLRSVIDMSRLSVMGLVEVVKHLPDLLSAKQEILSAFAEHNIDIFVGIDAPDFNLRISGALKKHSLLKSVFCVQYVSPSVWAWREGRIHGIKSATDLVLCLFPFELGVYEKHKHPALCVGHPLLHKLKADTRPQREIYAEFLSRWQGDFAKLSALQNKSARPICVMAGSRTSEITAILPLLIQSVAQIDNTGDFVYLLPVVNADHAQLARSLVEQHVANLSDKVHILYDKGKSQGDTLSLSQQVMNASELILLASGTATLEALLLHRPMVVVYKVNGLTYHIAKHLVKIPYVSLPNILAHNQTGQAIVPELLQSEATPQNVARHAQEILINPQSQTDKLIQTTTTLRQDSHQHPAQAVLGGFYQFVNLQK